MFDEVARAVAPYYGWITLSIAITALIYWFGVSGFSLISHIPLPGPNPWPYVGNLLDVAKYGGLHKTFVECGKKYGKVYKMYLGRSPMITVADPEMLKHILVKDFDKFRNRPDFMSFNPPLDTENSTDVSAAFGLFSLDVIMRAVFGLDGRIQTDPDPELVEKALTVFDVPVYIRALSMLPFYGHVKKLFNINPTRHIPYFTNLAKNMLEIRKKSTGGRRDLVQLMLEARDENVKDASRKLTDGEIVAQSVVFLLAGSETTGATLALAAYHLAQHPDIQDKLLSEIDDGVRSQGDVSIYEFVQSLEYLDRVICEVLRHSSIGFGNVRQCMETCVIKGVEFPVGVYVNIPSYAIHRDPDFWPEPEMFDPDRFLPEEAEKRPTFSYMPFGLGPRQCIGTRMALLELKIVLVAVLQKIKFEKGVGTTEKLEFNASTILKSREHIYVKIVTRTQNN
ncbi:hypothetical protein ACROYT_G024364 [Oculina patagonica]